MKQAPSASLDSVTQGQDLAGFRVEAVYLDATDTRIGGRFVHAGTGFVLDLVFIETAPQAFIWVNSFPTSDMGEPHTQEHLLLGKGNKGRYVASVESMSLAESSAFTAQWRTAYHFHTIAGVDVFWDVLDHRFDGLLHPDYTDEEIRREVRNFGVAADPKTGELRLEEKGTVYNEMVRSFESSTRLLWRKIGQLQYGAKHPLALSSGGYPAAIREMTAKEIVKFHADNYHLGNMGMIAAFPRAVALGEILEKVGGLLDEHKGSGDKKVTTEDDLPAPAAAPAGTDTVVGFPHTNEQKPGTIMLAWPPTRKLSIEEETLLDLFLDNVAGDPTTNLYKKIVDSKSRVIDIGATSVWSWSSSDQGHPIYVGVSNVRTDHLNEDGIGKVRTLVADELAAIAALPDGSPELAAFNDRIRSRIVQTERSLAKFMNSPPRFGFRGTGSGWMMHLHRLADAEGFEKSLVMKPAIAFARAELGKKENIWRTYLPRWQLTTVEPYGAAAKPDPELLEREQKDRDARIAAELARLQKQYGTADEASTLARYKADYDRKTAELDAAGKAMKLPGFIDTPPMTLDDALDYEVVDRGGVKLVKSTFASMTGATVGAAFDLRGVAEDDLIYLAALSALMTQVGLFEDGKALTYDQVVERLRNEVLQATVYLTTNFRTGRAELIARAAGNDEAETARALAWVNRFLHHADWRTDNLARIRDVVDQMAKGLRNRMSGAEETWVNDPANIWERQTDPMLAHTSAFLTRGHDLHRLRWLLRDDPGKVAAFLELLAGVTADRDSLEELTGKPGEAASWPKSAAKARAAYQALGDSARAVADEALSDLGQLIGDVPDATLAADWAYLCRQIRTDLAKPPADSLAGFARVRDAILRRGSMRLFSIGSQPAFAAAGPGIDALIAGAADGAAARQSYSDRPYIREALRQREPTATDPLFVALVHPDTQSGVFVNAAPGFHYSTRGEEQLLRYLAGNLYTGHGAHSIFMKTWSAGLAYSNGLRGSLESGKIRYYAERCPRLPQTLSFVIDELRKAEVDPTLVDYAIAQSFGSRVAASFEQRGEAMAANLADGVTPEMVRGFRQALMALPAKHGDRMAQMLFDRMEPVYGTVLPGYGPRSAEVEGGVYFVIGPDKQLDSYQEYLEKAEGPQARLYRLYPRDFWVRAAIEPLAD